MRARWRCGTADRRWTPGRWSAATTCPVLIRAGRHIARTKRYIRELGVDLDDPAELPGGGGQAAGVRRRLDQDRRGLDRPVARRSRAAVAGRRAGRGDRGRARRRRQGDHPRVRRGRPARAARAPGWTASSTAPGCTADTIATAAERGRAPGPDGDQHRELPVVRGRRRQVTRPTPRHMRDLHPRNADMVRRRGRGRDRRARRDRRRRVRRARPGGRRGDRDGRADRRPGGAARRVAQRPGLARAAQLRRRRAPPIWWSTPRTRLGRSRRAAPPVGDRPGADGSRVGSAG